MGNHGQYNPIYKQQATKGDGGIPTSNANVLLVAPTWGGEGWAPAMFGVACGAIQNNSGSTVSCAFAGRLHRNAWRAGTWVEATTTYTDDTEDAQDAGASDFPLETLTVNDGSAFFATHRFGAIDILVGTASVGASAVRIVQYTGPAGWKTLTCLTSAAGQASSTWATGETLIMWAEPTDWTPADPALHGTGVPGGYYGIKIKATTATDTTAAIATSASLFKMLQPTVGLTTGSTFTMQPFEAEQWTDAPCDALCGLITTAHSLNIFSCQARVRQ